MRRRSAGCTLWADGFARASTGHLGMQHTIPVIPDNPLTEHDPVVALVVGASLVAEQVDRPVAYWLAEVVRECAPLGSPLRPVVVTDLWYLNHDALRVRPTISIGGPEQNALSAFLLSRLRPVFSVDDRLSIHLDLHMRELVACLAGVDAGTTAEAARVFAARYAGDWVTAADRAERRA